MAKTSSLRYTPYGTIAFVVRVFRRQGTLRNGFANVEDRHNKNPGSPGDGSGPAARHRRNTDYTWWFIKKSHGTLVNG